MKEKLLNTTTNFLKKYNNYSEKDEKLLRYGLEGLYLTLTKTIVILLLALALGILKEVIIVLVLVNIIRYCGFGFHAEKSYQCLIFSIICFVLIPLVMVNTNFSLKLSLSIASLCLINYLCFAPADTFKRPLKNKKKRLVRKILTLITGIIYTFVIVLLNSNYMTSLILSAMIVQVILINPLTYKIFGQPYNNYMNVKQA